MEFEFRHSAGKFWTAVALLGLTVAYLAIITVRYFAEYLSRSPYESRLVLAARLDPGNAIHPHNIGRIEMLARSSPHAALPWLEKATRLNPNNASYWIDLALARQAIGDTVNERLALRQAMDAAPRAPEIAWQVGNLFLSQGSRDDALSAFRRVIENYPPLVGLAIQTCWRVSPDVNFLLDNVVPPSGDESLLEFLYARKEFDAAAAVWQKMYSLQQPVNRAHLFEYVRDLTGHQQPVQAALVWRQGASMSNLAAYQPSPENLLVNGDFSLEILNGGFDWMYHNTRGVMLALDPNESHSSSRSLRIAFDGEGIEDAGIRQMVPVEPNTSYEFSGFYKATDLDGAGGAKFAVQDLYHATSFFMSEDLQNADFWKKVSGSFATGPETRMLVVRIARVPAGSPIRGKLWIDGLRLVANATTEAKVQ
jgi:cytochrome c-type biogenesis protein CcmH/NrfG